MRFVNECFSIIANQKKWCIIIRKRMFFMKKVIVRNL